MRQRYSTFATCRGLPDGRPCPGGEIVTPIRAALDNNGWMAIEPGPAVIIPPGIHIYTAGERVGLLDGQSGADLRFGPGVHHTTTRGEHIDVHGSITRHLQNARSMAQALERSPEVCSMATQPPTDDEIAALFPIDLQVDGVTEAEAEAVIAAARHDIRATPLRSFLERVVASMPPAVAARIR